MKKTILFALLAVLGMNLTAAQENEYVPFVREGVKWVYFINNGDRTSYHALELKGDTVLGGKTYKVMRKYSGSAIFQDDGVVPVCLREENKVVYGIVPGGKTYDDCPIGIEGDTEMQAAIASGSEFVLYDFSMPFAFLESRSNLPTEYRRRVIPDRTVVEGKTVKRYISHFSFYDFCMIEGIGFDGELYSYPLAILNTTGTLQFNLSHVLKDGEVIYRSERYKQRSTLEQAQPLMQEGVKWVNERVVVSHGVTTRSLYTYEFSGMNSIGYARCYRYEGDELDENATFVAYVKEECAPELTGNNILSDRAIRTMQNGPLNKTVEEGRNMMIANAEVMLSYPYDLYWFGGDYTDIGMNGTTNYFIRSQNEDWLYRENFVEVDPLMIDGYTCRRFAYLGEDGQPLAYVIEGIGFDSRDMGDLLTPFTLPPDPDADYQEWCGLSHVIKDGQIIYKGMCYHEPQLAGDVNGDGNINMDDLTDLINALLDNTSTNMLNDVDNDGNINMDDLTDLINILLTQ